MVQKDLCYTTVQHVIDSWQNIRIIKNYREVAGVMLFQKFFRRWPEAMALFGFSVYSNVAEISQSKRFIAHARFFIDMIDSSLDLLGPDIELLTEIMTDLGRKHIRYGVQKEMFPVMGECLLAVLEELLPDSFTDTTKQAWINIYKALTDDMTLAYSATRIQSIKGKQ